MTHTITAHFDGKVFVPDEPIELPVGSRLNLHFETSEPAPRFAELLNFAADLPDAPDNLSIRHNDYLSNAAR